MSSIELHPRRSILLLAVFLTAAIAGLSSGTAAAQTGTIISGGIPPTGGFGIIVFGGGSNAQLVTASGCPPQTAVFWATSNGNFVTFIPGANVGAVNAQWNALFSAGIPANTGLIGRCTDAATSGGAFTLFFVDHPATGSAQITQDDLRVGLHQGYDRIVLEFTGNALPGYRIEYLNGSAVGCGSGLPVTLQGTAVLQISLFNAVAHDDGGMVTVTNANPTPGFPTLREIRGTCDFEGHVGWAAGLASQKPFRVIELANPTRLVIDVSH